MGPRRCDLLSRPGETNRFVLASTLLLTAIPFITFFARVVRGVIFPMIFLRGSLYLPDFASIPTFIKPGFEILPRRWVVERTFSWFGRFRRLSKDYEYSIKSSTNFILLAAQRILLKRLRKAVFVI